MPDFAQHGLVTTLHDLGMSSRSQLEELLVQASQHNKIGLVLPVTAADMRAEPFARIVEELAQVQFIEQIVVVLGRTSGAEDYLDARAAIEPLGAMAHLLWSDGPSVTAHLEALENAKLKTGSPGKGLSVWLAFGYLLADTRLKAFALHDCDIVDYDRAMLARLCLPMVHPAMDFEFCKAFYARCTDRMHGRVVRLLMVPLLRALISIFGHDRFLEYLDSFRYPLAGEFAVTASLARSNRIPCDWGLEIGTLAEVFRNTSVKRVCQVDLGRHYEHKHQPLSLENPQAGLLRMASDILTTVFRTLASMGTVLHPGHFISLRAAYVRWAQDAIRQYHADSLLNNLRYDRHAEEEAIEGFARQITQAGESFWQDPSGGEAIPNWTRVLTVFPDFPRRLRQAAEEDMQHHADRVST